MRASAAQMNEGVDVVIPWVDDTDPAWREQKQRFEAQDPGLDSGPARYRDWGILQYWFRCLEANVPWVRNIHFVTWGHVPSWLNTDHPKLRIVKHEDFIPEAFLPTFHVRPIELNLHRIDGLSERFIYANDDMFFGAPAARSLFFSKEGLPRDIAALSVHCYYPSDPTRMVAIRDAGTINAHFDMNEVIAANWAKWHDPRYGAKLLAQTETLRHAPRFPGFYTQHCAQPLLRSTYEELWETEPDLLRRTCLHKFRDEGDVNQWLLREWQIASGRFAPAARRHYRYIGISDDNPLTYAQVAADAILRKRYPFLCINDAGVGADQLPHCADIIRKAFQETYPERCSFER